MKKRLAILISSILLSAGCSDPSPSNAAADNASAAEKASVAKAANAATLSANPLMKKSTLIYQSPDFDQIKDEHFLPVFEEGMAQQMTEINLIVANEEPATFDNTLVVLEQSGELLTRAARIFYNLAASDSNEMRREIQSKMSPLMAAHSDNIRLNKDLFKRIEAVYQQRDSLNLSVESQQLLEEYYQDFIGAGARLNAEQQTQIRALNKEHSTLTTQFGQNLLAETQNISVVVDTVAELQGLSEAQLKAAANAAEKAEHEGKYLLTLTNTTRQPIIASIDNRALRQRVWEASANRAKSGDNNNEEIITRIAQIRAQKAELLGQENWASFSLERTMAKTPKAVFDMFSSMVPALVSNVNKEAADIQALIKASGEDFAVQPWDWQYYAEKVRKQRYNIDETAVKQYFEFNRVLEDGVFFTMNRLFGVRFEQRTDLPVYHPEVKTYEVFDEQGNSLAIFYADYFARASKRGGAWMSSFVSQSTLLQQTPVIVNVMNIPKAPEGQPTLLNYTHITTMFHELGHGLHGMFSDVTFPKLAGTSVSRDFVEYPAIFQEDWSIHPEVISNYAKHHQTGESIPKPLLDKFVASRSFNMGFDTLEYVSAALLDMEWHLLGADAPRQNVDEFEANALKKHGVDISFVPPRYKSAFFAHSMGGGYAAGYYAYMWSEILAADSFEFMRTNGGLTRENGEKFRNEILKIGNARKTLDSYKAFRGQAPTTDAVLKRRGLLISEKPETSETDEAGE